MKKIFIALVFLFALPDMTAQIKNNLPDTANASYDVLSALLKDPLDSNILIVVNGISAGTIREIKKDILHLFPPDMIQYIRVLKGKQGELKYGEKGKAGVLEFVLKDVTITELKLSEVYKSEDSVYDRAEIEASFAGGQRAWISYLTKTLKPETPSENFAPPGSYTVVVGFFVDKTGQISDIKPLTKHGFGMEEEVIRVMSNGPPWVPAINNGRNVKSYRKQPVTFINALDFDLSTYTLIAGKSNTIEIKVDDTKDEDIEATVSSGTIIKGLGNQYVISVDKPGRILLTIKKKEKYKTTELGTVSLEVK